MIAGLATITPASGFVGPIGAILIGLLAALICYYMVDFIKNTLKIDDTLNVFSVYSVGSFLGTILLAPLGATAFGGLGWSAVQYNRVAKHTNYRYWSCNTMVWFIFHSYSFNNKNTKALE